MIKFTISGRFPGINQYIQECRKNRFAGHAVIAQSEEVIIKAIQKQSKVDILTPPLTICYTFYEPNKKRDKDNVSGFFHKIFQDSLVKAGFLINDGWDQIAGFHDYFEVDRENPRIEIKIVEGDD